MVGAPPPEEATRGLRASLSATISRPSFSQSTIRLGEGDFGYVINLGGNTSFNTVKIPIGLSGSQFRTVQRLLIGSAEDDVPLP